MNVNWFIWRPVLRQVATLEEVESYYSLTDLLEVHEALDQMDEMQWYAEKQASRRI